MSKKLKILIAAALLFFSNEYFSSEEGEPEEHTKQVTSHRGRGLGEGAYDAEIPALQNHRNEAKGLGGGAYDAEHSITRNQNKELEILRRLSDNSFPEHSLTQEEFEQLQENKYAGKLEYVIYGKNLYQVDYPAEEPRVVLIKEIKKGCGHSIIEKDGIYYIIEPDNMDKLHVTVEIPDGATNKKINELCGAIITPEELGMRQTSH
jgi:hypothetical protein